MLDAIILWMSLTLNASTRRVCLFDLVLVLVNVWECDPKTASSFPRAKSINAIEYNTRDFKSMGDLDGEISTDLIIHSYSLRL